MEDIVLRMIQKERDEITEKWLDEMNRSRNEYRLQHINNEVFEKTNRKFISLIYQNLEIADKNMESFKTFIDGLLEMGLPLSYLTKGLQTFRRLMLETSFKHLEHSDKVHAFYTKVDSWYDPIISKLVSGAVESWEHTVSSQRSALRELSAPLIPIFEDISVMPLIGTIDTDRAKQIMENLLQGVIEHRSEVVLIDITGVPVVDTMVAHHIIQAAEAVRLVGAECILVGIRPEIAQTIVNLGIDLSGFPTDSNLRKGIQAALKLLGREITDASQEGSA
ncbi:MAG TPA: STAS domain-containing protein [Bacillales bacterium]|nr:STAS domain-containing protein [Bacillales bacterium]